MESWHLACRNPHESGNSVVGKQWPLICHPSPCQISKPQAHSGSAPGYAPPAPHRAVLGVSHSLSLPPPRLGWGQATASPSPPPQGHIKPPSPCGAGMEPGCPPPHGWMGPCCAGAKHWIGITSQIWPVNGPGIAHLAHLAERWSTTVIHVPLVLVHCDTLLVFLDSKSITSKAVAEVP